MDTIKQGVQKLTGGVSDVSGPLPCATLTGPVQNAPDAAAPSGTFPGPSEFPAHSQREEGKAVGLQSEMAKAPITTDQESHYGFEAYKPAGKLMGKKCIVTGGDSGIGKAVAVMFAMEGADVSSRNGVGRVDTRLIVPRRSPSCTFQRNRRTQRIHRRRLLNTVNVGVASSRQHPSFSHASPHRT